MVPPPLLGCADVGVARWPNVQLPTERMLIAANMYVTKLGLVPWRAKSCSCTAQRARMETESGGG